MYFNLYYFTLVKFILINVSGPNWTLISGYSEGQTATAKADYNGSVIWAQPLDALFITKGIQGNIFYICVYKLLLGISQLATL